MLANQHHTRRNGSQAKNAHRQRNGQQKHYVAWERPQIHQSMYNMYTIYVKLRWFEWMWNFPAKRWPVSSGSMASGAVHLRCVRLGCLPNNSIDPTGVNRRNTGSACFTYLYKSPSARLEVTSYRMNFDLAYVCDARSLLFLSFLCVFYFLIFGANVGKVIWTLIYIYIRKINNLCYVLFS